MGYGDRKIHEKGVEKMVLFRNVCREISSL